jgi:hypothetical protein
MLLRATTRLRGRMSPKPRLSSPFYARLRPASIIEFGPRGPQALRCDLFINGERFVIKSCQRKGNPMSDDDTKAELERLRRENAALKKGASDGIRMQVSEKGAVSVYGMGRFPVTAESAAQFLASTETVAANAFLSGARSFSV